MYKQELDDLLKKGVFTQDEYNEFFKTLSVVDEKGRMTGLMPHNQNILNKYYFNGDLIGGSLIEFIVSQITPPLGCSGIDEVFAIYGYEYYGIADGYCWITENTITDAMRQHGLKPLEEASEVELWKIIAISSRYWECFYKGLYIYEYEA